MPYLKRGTMKDFIAHTKHVVKSMELLLANEGGEERILIPAAILHDVGFSKIDKKLQCSKELKEKREAQRQHLVLAGGIIQEILEKVQKSTENKAAPLNIKRANINEKGDSATMVQNVISFIELMRRE